VNAGQILNRGIVDGGETTADEIIFNRDMSWLDEVARAKGLLLAEVSIPSHGVGYEIATARYRYGIPVVCLHRPDVSRRCSAMIAGDPGITLIRYSADAMETMLSRLETVLRESSAGPGFPGE
jgi:hypothetical protein